MSSPNPDTPTATITQPPYYDASLPHQDCDGRGIIQCHTGTCFTNSDGYIGCCAHPTCNTYATCVDYNPSSVSGLETWDIVTCRFSTAPYCNTITNILEGQYAYGCGPVSSVTTVSYGNLVVYGSMSSSPTAASIPDSTVTAASAGSVVTSNLLLPPISPSPSLQTSAQAAATYGESTSILSSSIASSSPSNTPAPAGLSGAAKGGIAIGALAGGGGILLVLVFLIMRATQKPRAIHNISEPIPITLFPPFPASDTDTGTGTVTHTSDLKSAPSDTYMNLSYRRPPPTKSPAELPAQSNGDHDEKEGMTGPVPPPRKSFAESDAIVATWTDGGAYAIGSQAPPSKFKPYRPPEAAHDDDDGDQLLALRDTPRFPPKVATRDRSGTDSTANRTVTDGTTVSRGDTLRSNTSTTSSVRYTFGDPSAWLSPEEAIANPNRI